MTENNCENLRSISIDELIQGEDGKHYCFVIPSYQRGYRWDREQVTRLLDDLLEFRTSKDAGDATVGDFYCLQPIVVKRMSPDNVSEKMGGSFPYNESTVYVEVVDGQQRLTTIYILLQFFRSKEVFALAYERDKECKFKRNQLLNSLKDEVDLDSLDLQTADESYFIDAFLCIDEWFARFENQDKSHQDKMKDTLVNKTKVIWYELTPDSSVDCYSVFKNINNGKIPLTDAELVKAMLLNRKYFSPELSDKESNDKIIRQEQERYARLWDDMQHTLSDNRFWAFMTGNYRFNLPTRIDYLFRIAVKQKDPDRSQEGDLSLFSYYEEQLSEKKGIEGKKKYIEEVFEQIRKIYRTIQDWYHNYEIHNFIGYIMTCTGKDGQEKIKRIAEYLKEYENNSRSGFIQTLKCKIKENLNVKDLDTINYLENQKTVEKLLMLFNIMELNSIGRKFDFAVEAGGWSIEHIKAQHSEIVTEKDRKKYLETERERISKMEETSRLQYTEIEKSINAALLLDPLPEEEFTRIAERIDREVDGFDEADMHRLGNLALLSKRDNSSFNNAPFYEKRAKMLEWLNDPSKNIPYSTTKAFLKMYSVQEYSLDFTKWGKSDFDTLLERQKECLAEFISEEKE